MEDDQHRSGTFHVYHHIRILDALTRSPSGRLQTDRSDETVYERQARGPANFLPWETEDSHFRHLSAGTDPPFFDFEGPSGLSEPFWGYTSYIPPCHSLSLTCTVTGIGSSRPKITLLATRRSPLSKTARHSFIRPPSRTQPPSPLHSSIFLSSGDKPVPAGPIPILTRPHPSCRPQGGC